MNRLLEILLGLQKGFLAREGELQLQWNPRWPGQEVVTASVWNVLLSVIALLLVIYVYRREARSLRARVVLGICRGGLMALLIALLNRPVLSLVQSRTEPSVLAIMVDDSISMRVHDVVATAGSEPTARLTAIENLLSADDQALLRRLSKMHELRLYGFSSAAEPIATVANVPADAPPATQPTDDVAAAQSIDKLRPSGQTTAVLSSVQSVLTDLQGQRLAGVVVFTDGRDTPASAPAETLAAIKSFGVKVYPVAVGSDQPPRNVELQAVSVQDAVFTGDIVNVVATVRGSDYEPGHTVRLTLKDKKTGQSITSDGQPVEATATLDGDVPTNVELQFKSDQQLAGAKTGTLDLLVQADVQPGEIDDADNTREAQVAVLDAKISVLYVDGYPRWEYRYVKNEMIRDKTVDISCLLTSADPTFAQEGDPPHDNFPGPITRFPESIEELMAYDVVVFGDVDPRQFSDRQLQLINEFVSKRGGGFGMVAGPRWSPKVYHNTAIEPILPVNIIKLPPEDGATITQGWRPVLTKEGEASTIFRFFPDKLRNDRFLKDEIQPLFWYQRGVTVKPGVGEVYAEHPTDVGPDGHKSPLLVFGRFGAGRTMFCGYDDSWRWRFYTGESVFDTYWVQQLRYLSRSRKLGERRITLATAKPTYELGDQVRLQMRVLDPLLLTQLPETVRVDVMEGSSNPAEPARIVRQENLVRQEGQPDLYVASFTADRIGKLDAKLPPLASGVDAVHAAIDIGAPRLELAQPQVDRAALSALAADTDGAVVDFASASTKLPELLPSAAKVYPVVTGEPLWDAPIAMAVFLLLITTEWIVRKMQGMV